MHLRARGGTVKRAAVPVMQACVPVWIQWEADTMKYISLIRPSPCGQARLRRLALRAVSERHDGEHRSTNFFRDRICILCLQLSSYKIRRINTWSCPPGSIWCQLQLSRGFKLRIRQQKTQSDKYTSKGSEGDLTCAV